jgi:23S rRNA (guanosine2251-2'-O)-methyltransferase
MAVSRKRKFENHQFSPSLDETRFDDELRYGLHAVRAALEQPETRVMALWLDRSRVDRTLLRQIAELACDRDLEPYLVNREELNILAPGARHQGVIARCLMQPALTEEQLFVLLDSLEEPPFLLILDGVQDPHNLGACLRTAEAAGVHAVIAPKDRAVGLTSVVRKVASGAAERMPFVSITNLARLIGELRARGLWLVGTVIGGGESLYKMDLKGPLGLVLGAEDRGLRRLTRECCDRLAYIPMCGAVGSLNVSVAAGVCLFEAQRQRGFNSNLNTAISP